MNLRTLKKVYPKEATNRNRYKNDAPKPCSTSSQNALLSFRAKPRSLTRNPPVYDGVEAG